MVAGLADLVLQATTGTGAGNLTLTTLAGKRAFSDAFGTGSTHDVFYYFISHGSAQEWEVGTGHMSDATTLVRDTIIASSNANAAVNFSAGYKYVGNDLPAAVQILVGNGTVFGPGAVTAGHLATYADGTGNALADGGAAGALRNIDAVTAKYLANSAIGFGLGMLNGTLVESHSGGALTISIKTLAGADPSASDPVYFIFRDATAGAGDYVVRQVTAALSITIPSTATIGFSNSTPGRLWIVAFDNAGTVVLAVINCLSNSGGAISIFPLSAWNIANAVAVGSGSSSTQVFFSPNPVGPLTAKAYTVLGYMTWETGLAIAGTWNASPTRIQLYRAGVPLPGQIVNFARSDTGAVSTGTTVAPYDDTVLQNTEGDQYLSQSIVPTSAANLLRCSYRLFGTDSNSNNLVSGIFRDSTASALAASVHHQVGNSDIIPLTGSIIQQVGTTSLTTFKIRAGGDVAGTFTFNGSAGSRFMGGAMNSYISVEEISA